ncbi:MAG: ATP-binding cassette domain-containing protein [Flavobacteriales bacterium]
MIQVENIDFGYRKRRMYQGFSLSIDQGGIYGILGTNGTGKSTLLKLITGLLFPSKGNCKVFNRISSRRLPDFLSSVYLLPEEIDTPQGTVLKYAKNIATFYPKFSLSDFEKLMISFDVKASDKFSQMSYGQKKKAMIAVALASHSEVILLDEPTNGLDIPSKSQFRKSMSEFVNDDQIVLISTHQVRDLDMLLDRIILLNEGKLLVNNSVSEIESRLVMKRVSSTEGFANLLYAEQGLQGIEVIYPNADKEDSRLNLETFFNAVIQHETTILNQLNSK